LRIRDSIAALDLPEDGAPERVDLVLDGQQRLSAIFGAFQTELTPRDSSVWFDLYFDVRVRPSEHRPFFSALPLNKVQPKFHFPVKTIYDPVEYRQAVQERRHEVHPQLDEMANRFREVRIPFEIVDKSDYASVALIFSRVNRQGRELNDLDLLRAWIWSDEEDMLNLMEESAVVLEDAGLKHNAEEVTLKSVALYMTGTPAVDRLVGVEASKIREAIKSLRRASEQTLDFFERDIARGTLRTLPNAQIVIPVLAYFLLDGQSKVRRPQGFRRYLRTWFWRSLLGDRYWGHSAESCSSDFRRFRTFRESLPRVFEFPEESEVEPEFFKQDSPQTRQDALRIVLASLQPHSLISGSRLDLAVSPVGGSNSQLHHIYPRAYLRELDSVLTIDCLANLALLSSADNQSIGAQPPDVYMNTGMAGLDEALEASRIPRDVLDPACDYPSFIEMRSALLAELYRDLQSWQR
jgi:hypothetical protein